MLNTQIMHNKHKILKTCVKMPVYTVFVFPNTIPALSETFAPQSFFIKKRQASLPEKPNLAVLYYPPSALDSHPEQPLRSFRFLL
jgi:hypothetical protein